MDQLIGSTPLLRLGENLYAKAEFLNLTGSVKDRAAKYILEDAEARGVLRSGGTIIEPTSGNTGIALAALAVPRGYRCIIVMPDSMSAERIALMRAYGAEVVLTPGCDGMAGSITKAQELAAAIAGSFIPNQFENPANALAHYRTTGPEIWTQCRENVDIFVAGVGTGGTLTGTGRYLKEQNPAVQVVAMEPAKSPLLSQGYAGSHGLQGIGANFIPGALDTTIYDEVIPVSESDAYTAGRDLGRKEGVLVGISSGAALHAALILANRPENAGKTIVALLPDTGDRYLSTEMFR